MYIGMTGGIASGKNSIAKIFEELGCYTIDADLISKKVMIKDNNVYNDIVTAFGENILDKNKEVNRQTLKEIIFMDNEKRKLLESIVHPAIRGYESNIVSKIKSKDDKAIIISHAALLIETGSYKKFDALIVIYLDNETQLKRLIKRDNMDRKLGISIINSQMPTIEKLKYANFIIDNSGNIEQTREEVKRVYCLLNLHRYTKKQLRKLKDDNTHIRYKAT